MDATVNVDKCQHAKSSFLKRYHIAPGAGDDLSAVSTFGLLGPCGLVRPAGGQNIFQLNIGACISLKFLLCSKTVFAALRGRSLPSIFFVVHGGEQRGEKHKVLKR